MRHIAPDGDPAVIVDRALTLVLADLERTKLAAAQRPRPFSPGTKRSRHIPATVRRAVWARDKGRCTFVGPQGQSCGETAFLEFHHREPYALGGATTIEGVTLRCRAHNLYEAEQEFGAFRPASASRPAQGDEQKDAGADPMPASAAPVNNDGGLDAESPFPELRPGERPLFAREQRFVYRCSLGSVRPASSVRTAIRPHSPARSGPS